MPQSEYVVCEVEGRWKVAQNGRLYGPYPSEEAALKTAISAANMASKNGQEAKVFVQGANDNRELKWKVGDAIPA